MTPPPPNSVISPGRTRLSPYVASLEVLRSCTNTTEASRLFAASPAGLTILNKPVKPAQLRALMGRMLA